MGYTIDQLVKIANNFEKLAEELVSEALEGSSGRKLDPKAKARNRGDCVFPAESSKVSDHKDHFLIGDIGQARNALARAGQYSELPPWFKGSLEELKAAIRRKVHSKYPSIEVSTSKKKK
jgi:hypothetical protein